MKNLRFTFRQLIKNPIFAAIAILTLALGIGANTAIFSALHAVLLRSLPVSNPQELRLINWVGLHPQMNNYTSNGSSRLAGGMEMGTSFPYPAYRDFRDHGTGFTDVFAFTSVSRVTAVARGQAAVAATMLVSGNYFRGYGTRALIGRSILPEDDRPDAPPVAVITYRWWERRYGLDPEVLGQTVTLNKASYQIIGVLPGDYVGPVLGDPFDIYVPMSAQPHLMPNRPLDSTNRWWVQIMGRLAPGAREEQIQESLGGLFREALGRSDSKMERPGILLQDGSRGQLVLRQKAARPFYLLLVVTGMVLGIVCANLAGLLLVRGGVREREMAVRIAIGAGRGQLIRQSLTESLVLSLLGAGLGLLLAYWINQALLGFLSFFPDSFHFDLRLDSNVLWFALCTSVGITILFGILPALQASHADPLTALKNSSARKLSRLHMGKVLVILQVGLSMLIILGAGLMIRTFNNLSLVRLGFDPQNILLFRIDPGKADYKDQRLIDFFDRTQAALAAIPGVQSVAFSGLALTGGSSTTTGIEFPGKEKGADKGPDTALLGISENFFRTMAIPLLTGRMFQTSDTAKSQPVAIVNETFARRFFPNENPIGQYIKLQDTTDLTYQVVGLVRDSKYNEVRDEVPPLLYYSQRQRPQSGVYFELRSAVPPLSLLPTVQKTMAALDRDIPLSEVKTQARQVEQSLVADRLFAVLGGAMAALAVLLSCIGLYGLMSYNQIRRSREIGIRMALGATPAAVLKKILVEAGMLVAIGLAVGVPVALMLTRLMASRLYGVTPSDPITLISGILLLIAVAMLSAWIPARRAARTNPMTILRAE